MNPALKAQLDVMALGDQSWKLFARHYHLDWYLVSNGWEKAPLDALTNTYLKDDVNVYLSSDSQSWAYKACIENTVWLLAREKGLTACEFTKDLVEGYIASNGVSGFEGR